MTYQVIIPAAGKGSRMQQPINKVLLTLAEHPIIWWTVRAFDQDIHCSKIIIACQPTEQAQFEAILSNVKTPLVYTVGGDSRQATVKTALDSVDAPYVMVHDAARPFITQHYLTNLYQQVKQQQAVILAVPVKDTIKVVTNQQINQTPNRSTLYAAQTPQAFETNLLKQANASVIISDVITDDASIVEQYGHPVMIINGDYHNIKITTPEDMLLAERILQQVER